ncbi:hypothetical protein FIBSPDRAFT_774645 [Athelia psychrophila]|uniref:Uncharacterized protein n=1 Tax=Athelia psychrophila TaxID=1759441 RepID=A0A166VFK3_9AGAM|nr:hypothetical protein FIBSPDRAFT_774645 [Fibularhizoctonia sp. CBS 109695]
MEHQKVNYEREVLDVTPETQYMKEQELERKRWKKTLEAGWDAMWAEEREKEKKKWAELEEEMDNLRQHLLEVEENALDMADWVVSGDTPTLDRITIRQLIDKAQGNLAVQAGLTDGNRGGASRAWKDALGPSLELPERLEKARSLLRSPNIQLDSRTTKFLSSTEGMKLVAEAHSSIFRSRGDETAPVAADVSHAPFADPVSKYNFSTATPDGSQAMAGLIHSAE